MKQGRASYHSIRHSDQSSATHKRDVEQAKLRKKKERAVLVEWIDEKEPFASDVSLLGGGQRFALRKVDGGRFLESISSADWEKELTDAENNLSWYHQPRKNSKSGYTVRKVKDRTKLGEKDKRSRNDTDLQRETIDLRPDHSRAVQYFLESGHVDAVREILSEVRLMKIKLFQKCYPGRRVLFASEHDDSGQYHNDLWHSGIREQNDKLHDGQPVRERVPFRRYGVGVGVTSWFRHKTALVGSGQSSESAAVIMGEAWAVLHRNIKSARQQNEEFPRDIKLTKKLDTFVGQQLEKLAANLEGSDREIPRRACAEYAAWLIEGYGEQSLGVRKSAATELILMKKLLAAEREKNSALILKRDELAARNEKFGEIVKLATRLILKIQKGALWKAIERLCAETAAAARNLSYALAIIANDEKDDLAVKVETKPRPKNETNEKSEMEMR